MTKKNIILTAALAAVAGAAGVATTTTDASAQAAAAPTHSTSWTGTVGEDRFGESRFKMRGRFQYDIQSSDWDDVGTGATDENGTRSQVRRAFLGVQGRLTEQWRYKVDFVLDPGANPQSSGTDVANEVGVDDAFLEYAGDTFSLVIGEHNVTSPLEDRTSSLDTPFTERASITNAFGYGRSAGLGLVFGGANWSLATAVQGDSLNADAGAYGANENSSISARGTWAPIYSATPEGLTLLHLGLSARQRDAGSSSANGSNDDSIDIRPLLGRGSVILDSGIDARQDTTYAAEIAGQFGAFGFQAEYATMELDDADIAGADGVTFDSYYIDGYWSITGESRVYDPATGSFKATRISRPMSDGGWGHWGVAVRYDTLDLTDGGTSVAVGGETESYAVGLTWMPIDNVLFRLNWAHTELESENASPLADDEADIVTLRSQFSF